MHRHLCIGSQLYINGTESVETVRALVRQMKETNLVLIRLFMTWDLLEPRPGQWDFSLFDAVFDEAEKQGMAVVPTLMAVTAPGWMHLTTSSQDLYDLDNPALWERGLSYVDKVVQHYAEHPALHSWILWNEPSRSITLQPSNLVPFIEFLQKKYTSIAHYNERHYRVYDSFAHLAETYLNVRPSLVFQPYTDKVDLMDYTVWNLCQKLKDIKAHVRLWDKIHLVHINPHDIAGESYANGQDFFEEGKCVDFLGCSAHPSWHSMDFPKSRIPLSIAFFADVMKAAGGDSQRFWVTELQGGTNLFSGKGYICPDAKEIGLYLAASFATGAEAVVFWCFNTRQAGFEAGEWGLLNQLGERGERSEAVAGFARLLQAHQDVLDASLPATPDVFILYSDASIRLQMIETVFRSADGVRNKNNGKLSLIGAYEAVTDLGYTPGFISEEQVQKGQLPAGCTLLMPDTYSLMPQTLEFIRTFVEEGGRVIGDGLLGMKTPDGEISPTTLRQAAELFGGEVEDITANNEPFPIRNGKETGIGEFFKVHFRPTTGYFCGDTLHHSLGQGHTMRIPGILFRHYFRTEAPEILDFLRAELPAHTGLYPTNPQPGLVWRTLRAEQGNIHFLYNTGSTPLTAELSENAPITMWTAHTPEIQNGRTCLTLNGQDFAVFCE